MIHKSFSQTNWQARIYWSFLLRREKQLAIWLRLYLRKMNIEWESICLFFKFRVCLKVLFPFCQEYDSSLLVDFHLFRQTVSLKICLKTDFKSDSGKLRRNITFTEWSKKLFRCLKFLVRVFKACLKTLECRNFERLEVSWLVVRRINKVYCMLL